MSKPSAPRPHKGVEAIKTYVGGGSKASGKVGQKVIKLSSNETPLGCSPRALAAARASAAQMSRYPDGDARALREALAKRHGIEAGRIICGAGSDEIFHLVAQAYLQPGDEILYSAHGFLVYPIVAQSAGAVARAVPEQNLRADVDAILAAVSTNTRIVFLANPNNPTGSFLNGDEMRRLHQGLRPDILLLLDAAYAEYVRAEGYENGLELARRHNNVIMTRTFSKAYGLAAARLGWGYADGDIIDALNRVRGPFNVSGVAQSAGIAALEDEAFLQHAIEHNHRWLPWLAQQIAGAGFEVFPSVGNFLLIRIPPPLDAAGADAFLLQRGIILRRMEGYGLPDCLRLSVGLEEENHAAAEAFVALGVQLRESIAS